MKELVTIQSKLKAPKGQYNSFGKYKYRSCEDILESVKPLLSEQGCQLTLSDEIVEVAGRIYVKATAKLTNADGEVVITAAYAREEEKRAGMDASQITGSASSYARKYALNGLFAIDDTKDPDATNTHGKDGKGKVAAQAAPAAAGDDVIDGMPFINIEAAIMCCNDTKALTALYNDFKEQHAAWVSNDRIMAVFTRRKHEINGAKKG